MKTTYVLLSRLIIIAGIILTSCKKDDEPLIVKDRDGNIYHTVIIGSQIWMVENLKTTKYDDGISIPIVTGNTAWSNLASPGCCWYNNDQNTHGDIYGALYNWYAVETGKLCPSGWHVATDNEWKELEMELGMSQSAADDWGWNGSDQGSQLAGNASLWNDGDLETNPAFNSSGFIALPGGIRPSSTGTFDYLHTKGYWWTATDAGGDEAWFRSIDFNHANEYRYATSIESGFSVRCIKD